MYTISVAQSGRNIVIDTTEDNIFMKKPESTLSVDTILTEVGKKTSLPPSDLVLLDSKLLTVSLQLTDHVIPGETAQFNLLRACVLVYLD